MTEKLAVASQELPGCTMAGLPNLAFSTHTKCCGQGRGGGCAQCVARVHVQAATGLAR